MRVEAVEITVRAGDSLELLQERISRLIPESPMVLAAVDMVDPDADPDALWRLRFTAPDDLEVSFRKVAEMQMLLAAELDIRTVDNLTPALTQHRR